MVPLGYYTVTLVAKGPNGTPVHTRSALLRLKSTEYISVSASAVPPSICPGSTSQLLTTAQGGVGTYSYQWLPITGLNDPSLRNPLASPTLTTIYHVTVSDQGGHSAGDSVEITIMHVPSTPGPILGPDSVCRDSISVFYIADVPGATSYSWTVPAGASILSGQNTSSVHVKWNQTGGTVSVIAGNDCGNSNPSVKPIILLSLPATPNPIIGQDSVCQNSTEHFMVDAVPDATQYYWSVPDGTLIVDGQNTRSIHALWGDNSGLLSVIAGNHCGTSDVQSKAVFVNLLPGPAGTISGKDTVCVNHENFLYSIPVIPGALSYEWDIPAGSFITSGDGTESIHVDVGPSAISGQMLVHGINECGSGSNSTKEIIVKACAGTNEINNNPAFQYYFSPSENRVHVTLNGMKEWTELTLLTSEGKVVARRVLENLPHIWHSDIDVSGLHPGLYIIKILNNDRMFTGKVIL